MQQIKPSLHFCLSVLLSICYFVIPGILVAEVPVQEKQVDIIRIPRAKSITREEPEKTIDVKKVARNLHDREIFNTATHALIMADNVCLSSDTVKILKTALDNNSEEIRIRAIRLLGLSRNREAIKLISNSLQKDQSKQVRSASAANLGRLAGEEAIPALKAALANDPDILDGVFIGLGKVGGTTVPILLEILEDKFRKHQHFSVSNKMILGLGSTCDRRVIEPLIDILLSRSVYSSASEHYPLKFEVVEVLKYFAMEDIYSVLLKHRTKFSVAQQAFISEVDRVKAADRTRIIAAFKKALSDSKPEIQESVRMALKEIRDEENARSRRLKNR